MKYNIGDRVKIISLEKVRSYPVDRDAYLVGNVYWLPHMNVFAGTIRQIRILGTFCYFMKDDPVGYVFSEEMIEGPAEEAPEIPYQNPLYKSTIEYAERLERFVLAVAADYPLHDYITDKDVERIMGAAKALILAVDEEIKKHRI